MAQHHDVRLHAAAARATEHMHGLLDAAAGERVQCVEGFLDCDRALELQRVPCV